MKRVLNVAVIEDDEQYKAIYSDLFSKANEKDFDFKVSFFNNGTDFLETYKSDYDFIITDIEMPEVNGLDICKEIREKDKYIPILIVSHSAQYAVTGYKVNAFGYIVKPIIPYDFYFQLNKITEYISKEASSFISVNSRTSLQKININDIGYIQVSNHTLVIKTLSNEIRFRGKIKTYENLLCRNNFIRCDNSVLVNLRYCSKVNVPDSTIEIFGKEIQISRPRKKEFLDAYVRYLGTGM